MSWGMEAKIESTTISMHEIAASRLEAIACSLDLFRPLDLSFGSSFRVLFFLSFYPVVGWAFGPFFFRLPSGCARRVRRFSACCRSRRTARRFAVTCAKEPHVHAFKQRS